MSAKHNIPLYDFHSEIWHRFDYDYNFRINIKEEEELEITDERVQSFLVDWKNKLKAFRYKSGHTIMILKLRCQNLVKSILVIDFVDLQN